MSALVRAKSFLLAGLFLLALDVAAWDRGRVERFAKLPDGAPNPEGITVDDNGDVYVTGFNPFEPGPGKIFVFDNHGDLLREVQVSGSSNALLGIAFRPRSRQLLVVDFGMRRVLNVDPITGASTVFADIPSIEDGTPGPNALTFDSSGNVYISDSFQGTIWKTKPDGVDIMAWVTSPLLSTSGVPPFGANGLDFNKAGNYLFVANTGNDTIVRIPATGGTPEVFTNSVNGADGLFVDKEDNIWVCANQSDEIVVIDSAGKAIAKLGDFRGVRRGLPVGLLFPASLARHGNWLYVTNLSLDLRLFNATLKTIDSQWAAEVTRHTISRIRARIPEFERGHDD